MVTTSRLSQNWNRLLPGSLLLVLLATVIIFALASIATPQPHAEKHTEAQSIRSCLDEKGPYQIWRHRVDIETFYLLCQLPDGKWGLQAIKKEVDKWVEKTAFIPEGDGSWKALIEYLKFATRWTSPLP